MNLTSDFSPSHRLVRETDTGKGVSVREVLLTTRSKSLADQCCEAVERIKSELPPIGRKTPTNARKVVFLKCDYAKATNAKLRGKVSWIPSGEHTFESLGDAARSLGLSPASLRQTFSAARRKNHGFDEPVEIFGLVLKLENGDTDKVSV